MNLPVLIRCLPGGLLAAALVVGPLNYGSTRPGGEWLLIALLGAAAVCWVAGLAVSRRLPFAPGPLLLGLGAVVTAALFWLSAPAQATAQAEFTREHFARVAARWPHSVVSTEPGAAIALHAALGFALWIAADLMRDRTWMVFFMAVFVGTAVGVTLLAVLQNLSHANSIYWRSESRLPGKFWGTFFHHTSAGAYLNTAWPIAAALALWLYRSRSGRLLVKGGAVAALLATALLLSAHTTHVSRFPQAAALIALVGLLWVLVRRYDLRLDHWAALLPVGLLLMAFSAGRTSEISQRWHLLSFAPPAAVQPVPPETAWPRLVRTDLLIPNQYNAQTFGDREEAQRTALRAIAARPLTGHGPANWLGAASRYSADPYIRSFYLYLQFAHADFLQAWVEFGAAGFLGLLVLLPGAVLAAARAQRPAELSQALLGLGAVTALALVLVQALFDFPLQIPAVALNASVLAGLCWSLSRAPAPALPSLSLSPA